MQGLQQESLDVAFRDVDADSWNTTRRGVILNQVFETYDLSYTLDDFRILDLEEDIAIVRYLQTMKRVAGPPMEDNTLDILQVFRKPSNKWVMFNQIILRVTPLIPPATQPATGANTPTTPGNDDKSDPDPGDSDSGDEHKETP